jgi:hypothetical protein
VSRVILQIGTNSQSITYPYVALFRPLITNINFCAEQFDIGLCAYADLLRLVAKFHDKLFSDPNSFNGLNKVPLQFPNTTKVFLNYP